MSPQGEYTIAEGATPTMLDSLMYKASFYDFGNVMTEQGKPTGWDRVRQKEIARKHYELDHIQEAFTRCALCCLVPFFSFSLSWQPRVFADCRKLNHLQEAFTRWAGCVCCACLVCGLCWQQEFSSLTLTTIR